MPASDTDFASLGATAIAPDEHFAALGGTPLSAESFEHLGAVPATPTERLQSMAQVVSQKNQFADVRAGTTSTPADDEAYIQAWKDKYNENPEGHSFWQSTKDIAGKIGPAIWGAAKNAAATVDNIVNPKTTPADAVNVGPAWLGLKYSPTQGAANRQAATLGLESGGVAVGKLGMDVFLKSLRGVEEIRAKTSGDQTHIDNAANIALQQLKVDSQLEHFTSSPYNAQTQPQQAAYFNVANAGTQMAAIPEVPGASKAMQVGGDFIENGAYKALGVGAKLVPPVAKTAEVVGGIMATAAHPAGAAAEYIGGKISDAAGMTGAGLNPFTWLSSGAATQSGLFKAVSAAGDQLIATPLGQNAIDSVLANAPKLTADATAKNLIARDAVASAQKALADAEASGASTIPAQSALRKAKSAATAANVYSHVIDKGASIAQWIQKKGMAGMPSKLADAVSGTIQGGIAGGIISDGNPDSISKGAAYGGILAMLGAASSASEGKPAPKIDMAEQMPTPTADFPGQGPTRQPSGPVAYPQKYPPFEPYRPDMPTPTGVFPGQGPSRLISSPVNYLKDYPLSSVYRPDMPVPTAKFPGSTPPTLRQAAEAAIATKPNMAVIDGVPHDIDALAENLSNVGKSTVNEIRKDSGETFKLPMELVKARNPHGPARAENEVSVQPSDQDIFSLAAKGKNAGSSAVGKWAYDEDKRLAILQFFEKGKGQQHYAVTELDPQGWQAWQEAHSIGAHFNYQIRKAYPIWRIHQNIWSELAAGPREQYRASLVTPDDELLERNKPQRDPNVGDRP